MSAALTSLKVTPPAPVAPVVPANATVTTAGHVTVDTSRPEWLEAKFADGPALAKAYKELEAKLGAPKPGETKPPETPAAPAPVTQPTLPAGIDLAAIQQEFTTKGALSPETYAALQVKGIDRKTADAYISGQQALATQMTTALHAEVGGPDQFKNLLNWAKANMTMGEIAAYEAALDTGNVALTKMALAGINAKYVAANGTAPALVNAAGVPGVSGIEPYDNSAQVMADIKNPKYATDDAFRNSVKERLRVSPLFQ